MTLLYTLAWWCVSGAGWEDILGKSYTNHQRKQQSRLGRGKREKMQVCRKACMQLWQRWRARTYDCGCIFIGPSLAKMQPITFLLDAPCFSGLCQEEQSHTLETVQKPLAAHKLELVGEYLRPCVSMTPVYVLAFGHPHPVPYSAFLLCRYAFTGRTS